MPTSLASPAHEVARARPPSLRIWMVVTFFSVALLAGLLGSVVSRSLHPDPAQQALTQARQIYNACQAYAAVRGQWPEILDDLVPDFLPDHRALADPRHRDHGGPGYLYFGSGARVLPPSAPFLVSKPENAGARVIIRADGRGEVQPVQAGR